MNGSPFTQQQPHPGYAQPPPHGSPMPGPPGHFGYPMAPAYHPAGYPYQYPPMMMYGNPPAMPQEAPQTPASADASASASAGAKRKRKGGGDRGKGKGADVGSDDDAAPSGSDMARAQAAQHAIDLKKRTKTVSMLSLSV